jgi:hypothetical protein
MAIRSWTDIPLVPVSLSLSQCGKQRSQSDAMGQEQPICGIG